jgi:hypothetical protein
MHDRAIGMAVGHAGRPDPETGRRSVPSAWPGSWAGVPIWTRVGVAKHNLPHPSFTSHHFLPSRDWRVGYAIGPVIFTVLAGNSSRQVTAAVTQRAQDQCTRAYNAAAKGPASSEGQAGQTSGPAKGFLAERCCRTRSSSVWYIDQVLDGPPRGIHLHLWPFSGSLPNCPPALELSNQRTATSQRHLLPESMAVVSHPYLEGALRAAARAHSVGRYTS